MINKQKLFRILVLSFVIIMTIGIPNLYAALQLPLRDTPAEPKEPVRPPDWNFHGTPADGGYLMGKEFPVFNYTGIDLLGSLGGGTPTTYKPTNTPLKSSTPRSAAFFESSASSSFKSVR